MAGAKVCQQEKVLGGCLCGQVRYEGKGEPLYTAYCHCRSCRHHTGAAAAAVVVLKQEQIIFTVGDRTIYNSSPGVGRGFCSHCGTTLTWEGHGEIALQIGTLDEPGQHEPTRHWFHEERIRWFDVASNLPRMTM